MYRYRTLGSMMQEIGRKNRGGSCEEGETINNWLVAREEGRSSSRTEIVRYPILMQPTNNIVIGEEDNARLPVLIRVFLVLPLCPGGLATELRIFSIFGFLSVII